MHKCLDSFSCKREKMAKFINVVVFCLYFIFIVNESYLNILAFNNVFNVVFLIFQLLDPFVIGFQD